MVCNKCNGTGYINVFEDDVYITKVCSCDIDETSYEEILPVYSEEPILIEIDLDKIPLPEISNKDKVIIDSILNGGNFAIN